MSTQTRKPRFKLFLMGIAIVVICAALAHGIATVILGRMVEARIESYKAKGEPVSMADLAGTPIPDSENGGVIYAKVLQDLKDRRDKERAQTWGSHRSRFLSVKEYKALQKSLKQNPDGYSQLQLLALSLVSSDNRNTTNPEIWNAARIYSAPAEEMLPKLEEAAAKPQCRYKADWQDGINAIFPYYAQLREAVRTLSVMAVLDAKEGNLDEAVRTMTDAYKLGESIKNEPLLIPTLVRVACIEIQSNALQNMAEYGHIDRAHAQKLYDVLSSLDTQIGTKSALNGERAMRIWVFKAVSNRGAENVLGSAGVQDMPFLTRISGSYLWRPFLYADELRCLDIIDKSASMAKQPFWEMKSSGEFDSLNADMNKLPFYAQMTSILTPIYTAAFSRRDAGVAYIYGDQIFLALLTYKDSFGEYPRTLDELRSKLGWKLNEDPFSGKDFIYKREGNGFLLYSIGPNLKDDGGMHDPRRVKVNPRDDIAWRMER